MAEGKSANWQEQLKRTSVGHAYQATKEAVRRTGESFEIDYQRARKAIQDYQRGTKPRPKRAPSLRQQSR